MSEGWLMRPQLMSVMCKQAVDAAQVDERAEIGDVLDRPLAELARRDLGRSGCFFCLALVLDQLAAADDDVAPLSSILRIMHSIS